MLESIALIGLPGSGKTRLQNALLQHQQEGVEKNVLAEGVCFYECSERAALAELPDAEAFGFVLCVIDVRSTLQAGRDDWLEAQLQSMLEVSHAVAFTFLEASGLNEQTWWGSWIKSQAPDLPIMRILNGVVPASWPQLVSSVQIEKPVLLEQAVIPELQSFEFKVGQICLDHLLLGLDSSKQNLGMRIARVTGVVNTLEYENSVEIQGSALRWDMFAADQGAVAGVITIQGLDLDRAWLEELVKASLV